MALLSPMERVAFHIADFSNRHLKGLTQIWIRSFMVVLLFLTGGRRIQAYGLQHVAHVRPTDRVILVANHRSFFDFFVVMYINFTQTTISSHVIFPVRSTFFYTRPLGVLVNFFMTGMAMFPPIMREPHKRAFNQYAVARVLAELTRPGVVVGFHPEGTRHRGPDPYHLLPARPGVGEIIRRTDGDVKIIPLFIVGMGNNVVRETLRNWFRPRQFPIDVVYGAPLDLSDLQQLADTRETHQQLTDACMDAVTDLGTFQRAHGRLKFPPASPTTTARLNA